LEFPIPHDSQPPLALCNQQGLAIGQPCCRPWAHETTGDGDGFPPGLKWRLPDCIDWPSRWISRAAYTAEKKPYQTPTGCPFESIAIIDLHDYFSLVKSSPAQPLIIRFFRPDIVVFAAFSGDFASSLMSGENNAHLFVGNIVRAAVHFIFYG
jgi:hypothetical protein